MTDGAESYAALAAAVEDIAAGPGQRDEKLQAVCNLLYRRTPHCDWVGFYLTDDSGGAVELGPFIGVPTEHVRIPFGVGVCGRAAEGRRTLVVPDVSAEDNYLSCCSAVRSEIVVPVVSAGRLAGVLDIDSHTLAAFGPADREFLESICRIVSKLL